MVKEIRDKKILFKILAILLLIAPFFSGCGQSTIEEEELPEPTAGQNGVLNYSGASRRTTAGIPLLFLKGTPYERGYQYGVLMRDEILGTISEVKNNVALYYNNDWDYVRQRINEIEANIPDDLTSKMRGIADGCGRTSYDDILLVNAIFGVEMCTSIALKVNGRYIHIKNTDLGFVEEMRPFLFIAEEDSEGNRMMYVTQWGAGTVILTNGMNDRGITLTRNNMPFYEEEIDMSDRIPDLFLRYQILANCSRMDEVESLIASFSTMGTRGFIVTSNNEDLAAKFEICPVRYGKQITDTDTFYLTNFFTTDNMREFNDMNPFFDSHTNTLNGMPTCPRYRLLEERKDSFQFASDTETISVLRDTTFFYDNNQYIGFPVIDANVYDQSITPDDVDSWLYSYLFTINRYATQLTLIMNPNQRYWYFSSGLTFAAFNELTKVNIRGQVDDHWNINNDVISADEEGKSRGAIFFQFLSEIKHGQRSILEISEDYMASDENNVVYYESYGRALLKDNVENAMNFFEDAVIRFPSNMFIKRLYGISLFEVFKNNGDPALLTEANTLYAEILNTLNSSDVTFPGLKLDLYYRLMLIAKEQGDLLTLEMWRTEFDTQYQSLGSPDYYPFSALRTAVDSL